MSKLFSITTYIGGIAVAVMALVTGIDIVGRYLFNFPLPCAFDLTGNFLSVVAACGFITATVKKAHIDVDSFYEMLKKRYRFFLDLISSSLLAIVFLVFAWQCFIAFYGSLVPNLELTPGTPAFVTFPFHLLLALSFSICFIVSLLNIYRLAKSKRDEDQTEADILKIS